MGTLLPTTMRLTTNTGKVGLGTYLGTELTYTDGSVTLTVTWDRRPVPASSAAVKGATDCSVLRDGAVVEVRDEAGSPESLIVELDGNAVDLSVTGDAHHLFNAARLTLLAEQLGAG
jgi:hypothetical protein